MRKMALIGGLATLWCVGCAEDANNTVDPWRLDPQTPAPEVDASMDASMDAGVVVEPPELVEDMSPQVPQEVEVRGLIWTSGQDVFFYPEESFRIEDPVQACGENTSIPRNSVVSWRVTGDWQPSGLRRFMQGDWRQTFPESPDSLWRFRGDVWQVTDERIVAATLRGVFDAETFEFEVREGSSEVCDTLRYVGGCLIPEPGDACAWLLGGEASSMYAEPRQPLPMAEDLATGAPRLEWAGDYTLERRVRTSEQELALNVEVAGVWVGFDNVPGTQNATQPLSRWMYTFESFRGPEFPITLRYLSDENNLPAESYKIQPQNSWISWSLTDPRSLFLHFSIYATLPQESSRGLLLWGGRAQESPF